MFAKKYWRVFPVLLGLVLAGTAASGARLPSPGGTDVAAPDPQQVAFIQTLVNSISEAELRAHVLALQNAGTRYAPSRGNLKAAHYIKAAFFSAGLKDAAFDEFSYYDEETKTYASSRNVVASLPGTRTPEKIVILGAHFDSITHRADDGRVSLLDKENPSPGADDNATGVAAVLAAARVLSSQSFDCTLRFIAFSGEEAGITGSAHYAAEAARKGEDIIGMINVDMLGYIFQEPGDMDIFANRKSAWLLDRLVNHAPIYAPDLSLYRIVDDTYDGSDQAPFWNNGYPGVCFMEDYYPSSRLYHTPKDTLDTINFPFFIGNARLAVGCFAELGGIHVPKQPAAPAPTLGQAVDWERDSRQTFLVTISSLLNQTNVIDISLPRVSSRNTVSLGDLPPETWGQPRDYPVAARLNPANGLVYVVMIKMRAPGKDTENGTIKIIDPAASRIVGSIPVGRFPTTGCFNADGTLYYQTYWGERYLDVIDTRSLASVDRIPVPMPLSKVVVDGDEGRAVAISAETGDVVFLDLRSKAVVKILRDIPSPRDVVSAGRGLALVCSFDRARLYLIDLAGKAVLAERETGPRPTHLAASPQGMSVLVLHLTSPQAELFSVVRTGGKTTLEKAGVVDTGETFADAVFADEQTCYFISTSAARLLGYSFSRNKAFWSMRTGGVRAKSDVAMILYARNIRNSARSENIMNTDFIKKEIRTDKAPKAIGPYSQAIAANGFVFASGQIPIDPATGQLNTGTFEEQARQVLKNLTGVLEAAGSSLDHIVKAGVFLQDMNDFAQLNAVFTEFFRPPFPARAAVQVARLPKDVKIEIEAIAVLK